MFGFTLLLLSRFCCFGRVSVQFRVTVTLATATLDVLALALLDGQQDTRHNASHDSEEHTEVAQRKGLHIHLAHKSIGARAFILP